MSYRKYCMFDEVKRILFNKIRSRSSAIHLKGCIRIPSNMERPVNTIFKYLRYWVLVRYVL